MNQRQLWNDPKIRAERQAKVSRLTGKPMELEPLTSDPTPSAAIPDITSERAHFEAILATFNRLAPKVGQLAAMEQAMEEHDRERDRLGSPRRRAEERRREEGRRA